MYFELKSIKCVSEIISKIFLLYIIKLPYETIFLLHALLFFK